MSDTSSPKAVKVKKYSELSDSQFGWHHIFLQWVCVRLTHAYFLTKFNLRVYGRENIPKDWIPCVVAANHISSMDPPLVSVALDYRPISYMAKIELFQTFWMRLYNWMMSSFAVNREKLEISTVKTAIKVLKHGKWAIGIFPEGGRRKQGEAEVSENKKGVAYFAKTGKVPVLPLGIYLQEGKRLRVCIGELIPSEGKDLDTLAEDIKVGIAALVEKAAKAP